MYWTPGASAWDSLGYVYRYGTPWSMSIGDDVVCLLSSIFLLISITRVTTDFTDTRRYKIIHNVWPVYVVNTLTLPSEIVRGKGGGNVHVCYFE